MTDGYEFIRFIYEEDQEETTDCNSRSTRYRYGRYCAALWCGNTSLNSDVSFFSFPTDARLEKWIHYSNRPRFREDSMVTIRGRRLCADHFGVSAFTNRLTRNRLRIIACPTVKVTNPRLKKLVPPEFFDDGQDSSTVPAPSSSTPGGSTQSLPPEPPTTDSAEEVDINSVEVITGIDADESVDACSASPPASPAFEYEQSPDNILPDPSEEDAEISACSDNSHLQNDGVESHASEGNDLNYSSPESDSDDEEATMMNIDTLPVEELRTSLRNVYRKYRRLKAVHLETTQLLEESSGKVERLEATLSELRLGHRDVS
uniref:Putative secreted protein n=1 Tax=Ixodes ricinus TaxID=34613 RepID=A0A0K8REL4_IXORI